MTIRAYVGGIAEKRALLAWRYAGAGAYHVLDRAHLHARQRSLCYLCVERFSRTGKNGTNPLARSNDHVFPRAAGGGREANVLLAHRSCNEAKADRWPFPCEVIYLAAVYALPWDAIAHRAARLAEAIARGERRRAKFDRLDA